MTAETPDQSGATQARSLREHLAKEDWPAAACEFEQLLTEGTAPRGPRLLRWLVAAVGQECLKSLIRSYARKGCPFCQRGMQTCEQCKDAGRTQDEAICRGCLGLGLAPCEFCSGSGLAAYSFAPDELRPLVLQARISLAIHQTQDLLKEVDASGGEARPILLHIANLNKLMGVIENAAIEAEFQMRGQRTTGVQFARDRQLILTHAASLEQAIRQDFVCLADLLDRRTSDGEAALYRRIIATRGFEGTCLDRPFLQRMLVPTI